VSEAPGNSKSNELDGIAELHALYSRLYDRIITDEELARLNRLLDGSPSARQLYFRYVELHSALVTSTGRRQGIEAEVIRSRVPGMAQVDDAIVKALQENLLVNDAFVVRNSPRKRPLVAWAVAASLLAVVGGGIWIWRSSVEPTVTSATGHASVRPTGTPQVASDTSLPVARLSFVSPGTRWRRQSEAVHVEAGVIAGKLLELTEGEIELVYGTGTKILLIGPAEFLVEPAGGKLRRGGLMASVTDAGHGFTIETPNGRIVDLGTEFGVVVDDFGVSEVSVFQGKVEAFPLGTIGHSEKIELTNGHGLQWNQDNVISLDADLRRFAASVLDRAAVDDGSVGGASVVGRFRGATLDAATWRTLGDVQATAAGLQMRGTGAVTNPPYLVAAEQFDPAHGPITVTCDFQFADTGPDEAATFSILARSAADRGTAPQPWKNTLASCVRCCFGSNSHQGMLQAGVKLEADREVSSISWNGFVQPRAGVPYRVVMRDDGVNVSFTVSLRNNPSMAKTVNCRSLFRGEASFVALEGAGTGMTVIDRVEISQDRSAMSLASYAEFASLLLDGGSQMANEKRQLAALAPTNAELILQDDFAAGELDADKWTYLGDVVVRDGAIELGSPNPEAHIDTWKPRPYLLTRERLDPNDGTLTIIGRIRFADNFLAGYGASFAVMTRADDRHGFGPGWENSVLQRGVRANFWPAAWDLEHSLEIHEKPAANTITLLATQGVQVDPNTHFYLFRVVDDGQSATLTIVDPRRPNHPTRISSPTTTTLTEGFVGFESCWGSPVTLDDVQIYQSK
jgi:hypothetical protein